MPPRRFAPGFLHEDERQGGDGRGLSRGTGNDAFAVDECPAAEMRGAEPSGQAIVDPARRGDAAIRAGDPEAAREECARVARACLRDAREGLRALDLIVTIAPLIGLLGTVLGMIDAFQALQDTGARADPAALAGGIWEALLTTAAGMAVAIPASMALSWLDSVADGLAHDFEDMATRLFNTPDAPARAA